MKIANIHSGVLFRIMLRVTFLYTLMSSCAFLLSYNLIMWNWQFSHDTLHIKLPNCSIT